MAPGTEDEDDEGVTAPTHEELTAMSLPRIRLFYDAQQAYDGDLTIREGSQRLPSLRDALLESYSRCGLAMIPDENQPLPMSKAKKANITTVATKASVKRKITSEETEDDEIAEEARHQNKLRILERRAREIQAISSITNGTAPPPPVIPPYSTFVNDNDQLNTDIRKATRNGDLTRKAHFSEQKRNLLREVKRLYPHKPSPDEDIEQAVMTKDNTGTNSINVYTPSYFTIPDLPLTPTTGDFDDNQSPPPFKTTSTPKTLPNTPTTPTAAKAALDDKLRDIRDPSLLLSNVHVLRTNAVQTRIEATAAEDSIGIHVAKQIVSEIESILTHLVPAMSTLTSLSSHPKNPTERIEKLSEQVGSYLFNAISSCTFALRQINKANLIGWDKVDQAMITLTPRTVTATTGVSASMAEEDLLFERTLAKAQYRMPATIVTPTRPIPIVYNNPPSDNVRAPKSQQRYNCNRCKKQHPKPYCQPCSTCKSPNQKEVGHSGNCIK